MLHRPVSAPNTHILLVYDSIDSKNEIIGRNGFRWMFQVSICEGWTVLHKYQPSLDICFTNIRKDFEACMETEKVYVHILVSVQTRFTFKQCRSSWTDAVRILSKELSWSSCLTYPIFSFAFRRSSVSSPVINNTKLQKWSFSFKNISPIQLRFLHAKANQPLC